MQSATTSGDLREESYTKENQQMVNINLSAQIMPLSAIARQKVPSQMQFVVVVCWGYVIISPYAKPWSEALIESLVCRLDFKFEVVVSEAAAPLPSTLLP